MRHCRIPSARTHQRGHALARAPRVERGGGDGGRRRRLRGEGEGGRRRQMAPARATWLEHQHRGQDASVALDGRVGPDFYAAVESLGRPGGGPQIREERERRARDERTKCETKPENDRSRGRETEDVKTSTC